MRPNHDSKQQCQHHQCTAAQEDTLHWPSSTLQLEDAQFPRVKDSNLTVSSPAEEEVHGTRDIRWRLNMQSISLTIGTPTTLLEYLWSDVARPLLSPFLRQEWVWVHQTSKTWPPDSLHLATHTV